MADTPTSGMEPCRKTGARKLGAIAVALLFFGLIPRPLRAQLAARYGESSTLLPNGNILIVGGINFSVETSSPAEIYVSTAPNQSYYVSDCPGGMPSLYRSSHTATILPNGKVLIAGGVTGITGAPSNQMVLFNPVTNACEAAATNRAGLMFAARVHHTATLLADGRVLIAGGDTATPPAATPTNLVDIYDPAANTLAAGPNLIAARAGQTASILYNGTVLIAGGYAGDPTNSSNYLGTTEIFSPTGNTFQPGPSLAVARAFHTATMLGTGYILFAGGYNAYDFQANKGFLQTVELYNPFSNSMTTPPPTMNERRTAHAAVLEPDGTVSLLGGLGNITTSYFAGSYNFGSGSVLAITPTSATGGIINAAGSLLNFPVTWSPLSEPANGTVVLGNAAYACVNPIPTGQCATSLTDATINFFPSAPNSIQVSTFNGAVVSAVSGVGQITNQTVNLQLPTGSVTFTPQNVATSGNTAPFIASNSTIAFTTPCTNNGTPCTLTNTSILRMGVLTLPFPASDYGATITGVATITNFTLSTNTFTVTFNGGGAKFTCNTWSVNSAGNAICQTSAGLTFSGYGTAGLSGSVTSSTQTLLSPLDLGATFYNNNTPSGAQMQLSIAYNSNQIQLGPLTTPSFSGAAFNPNQTQIAIARMVFSDRETYNPAANTWSFGGTLGQQSFNHSAVLAPNGDIRVFGGQQCDIASPSCSDFTAISGGSVFIPQKTLWNSDASLGTARSNHTATMLPDGKILVAGGATGPTTLNSSELYDPTAKNWSATGTMNFQRAGHAAVLLPNGRILVAGGFTSTLTNSTTNTTEIYYEETGQWIPTSPMNQARQNFTLTLLPNGNVLAAGGFTGNNFVLSSAEIYVTTAAIWMPVGSMSQNRADHTATLLQDGSVLAVGGSCTGAGTCNNGLTNTAEDFNSNTYQWTTETSLVPVGGRGANGRYGHTATLLRDGRVLVAGGDDGLGEIGASEIYNPVGNAWSAVTALGGNDILTPRLRHTAVLLPDGKVLIIGGETASQSAIKSVEGFDVDESSWGIQGNLTTARAFHASVLLGNGNVLNIGGSPGPNQVTSKCENQYYAAGRDSKTPISSPPFSRIPSITSVDSAVVNGISPGLTINGSNFTGVGEVSGGGDGPMEASFGTPRVYLQAVNSASGFLEDISTSIYYPYSNANNTTGSAGEWQRIASSITLTLPAFPLPFGWYHVRAAANAQFSNAFTIQAGPAKPLGAALAPGVPQFFQMFVTSVTWKWPAAGGCPQAGVCDGYSVYAYPSGVFISTFSPNAPFCSGGVCTFTQKNIPPGSTPNIMVAAYDISGDGPMSAPSQSTNTTATTIITTFSGQALAPTSINWSWSPPSLNTPYTYTLYSSTSGQPIATGWTKTSYTEIGLSTNSFYDIGVLAIAGPIQGQITWGATTYTQAAPALTYAPNPTPARSTDTVTVNWSPNTNPPGTFYQVAATTQSPSSAVLITTVAVFNTSYGSYTVTGLPPNTPVYVQITALDFNNPAQSWDLASSLAIISTTNPTAPNGLTIETNANGVIQLTWGTNGNPSNTQYQVEYSQVPNFDPTVSTIALTSPPMSSTAVIQGLTPSVLYFFRAAAINANGTFWSPASTETVVSNGGAPIGNILSVVNPGLNSSLSGIIDPTTIDPTGANRAISLNFVPNTFSQPVTVLVSTRTNIAACGAINAAISISPQPYLQPAQPITLSMSYTPAEIGAANPAQLVVARYDPTSKVCVPLVTSVDTVHHLLTAQLNHLSDFQIMAVTPQATTDAVRTFPNPLQASTQGYMTLDRMPANAHVRIFTLHGEILFDQQANASGMVLWPAVNKNGRPVGSGMYLAVIEANGQKQILKLAVIR